MSYKCDCCGEYLEWLQECHECKGTDWTTTVWHSMHGGKWDYLEIKCTGCGTSYKFKLAEGK